jgi:hypothetical protein
VIRFFHVSIIEKIINCLPISKFRLKFGNSFPFVNRFLGIHHFQLLKNNQSSPVAFQFIFPIIISKEKNVLHSPPYLKKPKRCLCAPLCSLHMHARWFELHLIFPNFWRATSVLVAFFIIFITRRKSWKYQQKTQQS